MTGSRCLPFRLFPLLAAVVLASQRADASGWLRQHERPTVSNAAQEPQYAAVCRIIVPERDGLSYGSGTLVAAEDQYGLVITNWHVVRDAAGTVTVVFPDGFRSGGRVIRADRDWDLAALLIWRPRAAPVAIAARPPRKGDVLTIAGYGAGTYRAATGRCTQYVSPGINLPFEMIEVSVEARQGDSGGPIFNDQGQLAGVLFGASRGTTAGSFAGRVGSFLASISPRLARLDATKVAAAPTQRSGAITRLPGPHEDQRRELVSAQALPAHRGQGSAGSQQPALTGLHQATISWHDLIGRTPFQWLKTALAAIGALAVVLRLMRWFD